MNLLCIDTSTNILSLAVSKNEKILKFRNVKLDRPMDKSIMPSIKGILSACGLTLTRLDGFAVGLGPGSFTSLRVGLSAVKGMAFAAGKPVIGTSSLDLLAMNVLGDAQVCTLNDARRHLVYACVYDKKRAVLKRKSEYLLTDIHSVLRQIKGDVSFIGDGIKLYKEDIKKAKGLAPSFMDGKDAFPQARRLPSLVLDRARKDQWDPVDRLVPLYLYPDHCQIRKSK